MKSTPAKSAKPWLIGTALLALFLATTPQFFDIYRTAAFNTVPRDDYAPYLLALAGQGGEVPDAPYAYRAVSVAMAIPFYFLLPVYIFSNLEEVPSLAYLRAIQALSLVSYLSMVLTSLVIYMIARRRYAASRPAALSAALLSFILAGFVSRTGVDPFGILVISALLWWLGQPKFFLPLIGLSVGVNEKIPIIFATMAMARLIASILERRRFALLPQLLGSCMAIVAYSALVVTLQVPGNQHLFDPAHLLQRFHPTLIETLSARGMVLNGIPILILVVMVILASHCKRNDGFQMTDVASFIVLVILAAAAEVHFNVGRIAMYTFPLFLPATAPFLDRLWESEDSCKRRDRRSLPGDFAHWVSEEVELGGSRR